MRNAEVIKAWMAGNPAQNHSETLVTNGDKLWSYSLLIGLKSTNGEVYIINYTAPSNFISQTTSRHVGLAKRLSWAFHPMEPEDFYKIPQPAESILRE